MKILVADCCIRGRQSRTARLMDSAVEAVRAIDGNSVDYVDLKNMELKPFNASMLEQRDALLARGEMNNPMFEQAARFADADMIIIAAPYWDMSFPSQLKIYIEHITVSGITFGADNNGLKGLCRASSMLYLTTRGGYIAEGAKDEGAEYLRALCEMYGIGRFEYIGADGMDIPDGNGASLRLESARRQTCDIARELAGQR